MSSLTAQSFAEHIWKHRLILLFIEDVETNGDYMQQLEAFQAVESDMIERKLLVYHITPTHFATGTGEVESWQASTQLYHKHKQTNAPFELHLIGLDGGLKLKEVSFIHPDRLFSHIDAMPIRQAEIHRKK